MSNAWWQPKSRKSLKMGAADVSISFERRDIWIGVFWDHRNHLAQVFVTIIPCFPLRIAWPTKR